MYQMRGREGGETARSLSKTEADIRDRENDMARSREAER